MDNGLKYIGQGEFLPGVPARDLSEAEVKRYGLRKLIKSGLYARMKPGAGPQPPQEA